MKPGDYPPGAVAPYVLGITLIMGLAMRATQFEYVLKGVFLGLWAFVALRQNPLQPNWDEFLRILAWIGGGLGCGFLISIGQLIVRKYRPGANPTGFLILVLLEGSFWVYLGLVGGLMTGILVEKAATPNESRDSWLGYCAGGGALLGFGFNQLRQINQWTWRFGIAAGLGALLVFTATQWVDDALWLESDSARRMFGIFILMGLPFFYILTFCGDAEESEVEIAALCAAMGIGLWLLKFPNSLPSAGFLVPAMLYFVYATRWLPGLRVFKHTLRGYGQLHTGRIKEALFSFRRARQINPRSVLANDGLWELHKRVDIQALANDPDTLRALDYAFCIDRATVLLVGGAAPSASARAEADRMLDLIANQKPEAMARVNYLRAVSFTHAKQFDAAAEALKAVLDPSQPPDGGWRATVIFQAWELGLRLHPEIVARVGDAELAKPGRRMDAIAAVETHLAANPNDAVAANMKTELYAGLKEQEFLDVATADTPPVAFNYDYVEQLGMALVGDPNSAQKARGMAYLRMAGRGLPSKGPSIFRTLAERAADATEAHGYREQVKRAGQIVGPKALVPDQREAYFQTLSELVSDAEAAGEYDAAIDNLRLRLEDGKGEVEGYRKLAVLYEKNKDPMNALLMTETGLIYNSKDADFLTKKDKYYYSVTPERLLGVKDKVDRIFDVDYCVRKANQILSQKEPDLELLDWAHHLIVLAKVIKPKSPSVLVAEGRLLLRKGRRDDGLALLEDVREVKPSGGDDLEAWFIATRLLGDMYLNELQRPDLALGCFKDYKEHPKSGADSLFNMARSYEGMNEPKNAIKLYEAVTAYEGHPKYWDATEAIRRLKDESPPA